MNAHNFLIFSLPSDCKIKDTTGRKLMTKRHVFAGVLIFVGTVIILFSAIGAMRAFRHMEDGGPFDWKPPAANQTDVSAIRDWMTVPYIAHMYDVPSDAIFKNLEIKKDDRTRK